MIDSPFKKSVKKGTQSKGKWRENVGRHLKTGLNLNICPKGKDSVETGGVKYSRGGRWQHLALKGNMREGRLQRGRGRAKCGGM